MFRVLRGVDHPKTKEEQGKWQDDTDTKAHSPDTIAQVLLIRGKNNQHHNASGDKSGVHYTTGCDGRQ